MRGPHRLSSRGAQAQRRNEVLRRSTQARCACSPFADIAIAALGADGKPFVMGRVGAAHAEAIDARPTAPDDPRSVGGKGSHRWRAGGQRGGWRRRWRWRGRRGSRRLRRGWSGAANRSPNIDIVQTVRWYTCMYVCVHAHQMRTRHVAWGLQAGLLAWQLEAIKGVLSCTRRLRRSHCCLRSCHTARSLAMRTTPRPVTMSCS